MAQSTTTTLAGLMERLQADTVAVFRTQSGLIDATRNVIANGVNSVQFPSFTAPSAVSALTQGNAVSTTTVTISAIAAALETYPVLAQVAIQALNGGSDVSMDVAMQIAGTLAATVDTQIATQFSSFTGGEAGAAGAALTLDKVINAMALLDATKFVGEKIIVLHPKGFRDIAKDLVDVAGIQKDFVISNGYITDLFGAKLYVSPYVPVDGSDDAVSAVYIKNAVGFAYRDPLMELDSVLNAGYAAYDILGSALMKATLIQAGAGIKLTHDTAL